MRQSSVLVVGGGLAGCEAAWQIAAAGIEVELVEMRPSRKTEAHSGDQLAELVCSNSFGSDTPHSASKMLKDQIEQMNSFVLRTARKHSVPAGASLAVDREKFAQEITKTLDEHPLIHLNRHELTEIPLDRPTIIATGPLTSPALCESIARLVGQKSLYFYDAISPIVSAESIDMNIAFLANRYGKGETADFLNLPLTKEQYETFIDDLLSAEVVMPHNFEEARYFEGCMPIEAIAERGRETLAFGPMKPVGLIDPRFGKRAHAVIQLRTENSFKTAYNLVGFQTKMKYKEQERIFRKLPGLEHAEFLRLGSMHRNTYLDSPRVLNATLQLKQNPKVFVAGQLTGTEGYLESTATGLFAGQNMIRLIKNLAPATLPQTTMLGALLSSITDESKENFQPMNSNMGILPPLPPTPKKRDKKLRNETLSMRAKADFNQWLSFMAGGL